MSRTPSVVVMLSGGLGSYMTARLAVERHGLENVALVFCDTLTEEPDLYRFLLETTADLLGQPKPFDLMARCLDLPEEIYLDEHLEQCREILAEVRVEAMARLPGLHWLADGRAPQEVWRDRRYIGNSRVAHCSIELKAKVGDRWVAEHAPEATVEFGLYWDELFRIKKLDAVKPRPVGRLLYESGLTHADILGEARGRAFTISRSYELGYRHDNCRNACCRAGQKQWGQRYRERPRSSRYMADTEGALLAELPGGLPMLREQVRGEVRGLPLHALFDRLDAFPMLTDQLEDDGGGCGCMLTAMEAGDDAAD